MGKPLAFLNPSQRIEIVPLSPESERTMRRKLPYLQRRAVHVLKQESPSGDVLILIGTPVAPRPADPPEPGPHFPVCYILDSLGPDGSPYRAAVFGARLILHGLPVFLEAVWNRDEVHIGMHGLEKTSSMKQVERAAFGLKFLKRMAAAGRPVGSGTWRNQEDFLTAVRAVVADLKRQHRRVTKEEVAAHFNQHKGYPGCDAEGRQLLRWIDYFFPGYKWKSFVDTYLN